MEYEVKVIISQRKYLKWMDKHTGIYPFLHKHYFDIHFRST